MAKIATSRCFLSIAGIFGALCLRKSEHLRFAAAFSGGLVDGKK